MTLPALLVGWEIMGAASYALIGFHWREESRVDSGLTAFLTTRAADLGLYLAAAAALAGGSGLGLAALPGATPGWRDVAAAGLLVAAAGKAAQLPFSFWLSRAMEGPSPVSALLHSAAMVAMGGYLLLRVAPLLHATGWAAHTAAWLGAATAVGMGLVAVAQRDLKQLLAASTAAQLGFVVMAAGLGAVSGGISQLIAHAATKAALFLAAGAWLSALGTKQLSSLQGVARRWPVVGIAAGVAALGLAGLPPLALWAAKDAVLASARQQSLPLYTVGLIGAALAAVYATRIVVVLWRRPPPGPAAGWDEERPGTRHIGRAERIPVIVLAAAAVVLVFLALPPVASAVRSALDAGGSPAPGLSEWLVSGVIAVVVAAAVVRWGPPRWRWAAGWWGLQRVVDRLVTVPVLHGATRLARFDDHVVDRGLMTVATRSMRAGRASAGWDDRVVDGGVHDTVRVTLAAAAAAVVIDARGVDASVEATARTVRRLGSLSRRPQTGQVHQYLLMMVVLLVLGAGLLVVVG
nr:proton-conducting transporter membrane subunit [Nakamurella flavida]